MNMSDAVNILKSGHVVGMPTETVYGLAGRIDSESAIQEIFVTKQRPFFDPLIVHIRDVAEAQSVVRQWPAAAQALAQQFWPGPLTLVLPKSEKLSGLITSGLDTVGVRCPDHPLALELIARVGVPLAAPSANLFGRTSPTQATHVEIEFKSLVPVLNGGACRVGIESTVLLVRTMDISTTSKREKFEIAILREGEIVKSKIENCLTQAGIEFQVLSEVSRRESPGHLKHHYMPNVPLIYCRQIPRCEEHLRSATEGRLKTLPDEVEGIRIRKPTQLSKLKELVLSSYPRMAARELYQKLRELSSEGPDAIYFVEPQYFRQGPHQELWQAIIDRLTKAASLLLDEELA